MHSHRPFLTQHRFQRLVLWTLAMLGWIVAILAGDRAVSIRHMRQRTDAIWLPWLTQLVARLVLIRAGQLARARRPKPIRYWRRGRDLRRTHLMRSVLGARFRGALKHKGLSTGLATLIAILNDIDAYAAPLARRLSRGLTRLCRTWFAIATAPLRLGPPAPPPAVADSS